MRAAGLSLDVAETVAVWQVVSGITGAALRLGICGHLGVQRVITTLTPLTVEMLRREPPTDPATFTAYADIAAQRRDVGGVSCSPADRKGDHVNLTPTELERLTVFTAAEIARRNLREGVRLSHPEAVALLTDEVMLAARKNLAYDEVIDHVTGLLTAAQCEPGVPAMVGLIALDAPFPTAPSWSP